MKPYTPMAPRFPLSPLGFVVDDDDDDDDGTTPPFNLTGTYLALEFSLTLPYPFPVAPVSLPTQPANESPSFPLTNPPNSSSSSSRHYYHSTAKTLAQSATRPPLCSPRPILSPSMRPRAG